MFIFLPAKINVVFQKRDYKRNLIRIFNSGDSKVVFTLLTKIVAVQMIFSIIHIRKISLKRAIAKIFREYNKC